MTTIDDCFGYTTIKDIKRKHIFDEGKKSYSADLFTLSHKDNTLQDDMILADCFTPGEDITLEVDAFKITLHDCESGVQKPLMLKVKDMLDARGIIESAVKPNYFFGDVFLGNSDNFSYNSFGGCCAKKDPPTSYHPGLVVYYRLKWFWK